MKKHKMILAGCIAILLAVLACNLPGANSQPPAVVTEPAAQPNDDNQANPSGLPTLTLQAGSGYLFDTAQVVVGSDDRDVWWNRVEFVPGTRMGSLGILDSISQIDQAAGWILEFKGFEPVVGESFLVEATAETEFAIIRVLSFGNEGEISFEYVYPFGGAILP